MSRKARYLYETELSASLVREEGSPYALNWAEAFPQYEELTSLDDLQNAAHVADAFQTIDWSFTTDNTGFLTHDLHPYPAKFIPQLPGTCISQLSFPGELVLDPFGGSGTTALEAVRLGRRALSVDANAVGTLIGRVKTCNLDRKAAIELHTIRSSLTTYFFDLPAAKSLCAAHAAYIPNILNIDKWFPITARGELALIRSRIARIVREQARDVALLALSRIILAASFQDSETRYTSKPRDIPQGEVLKRFLGALDRIIRSLVRTQAVLRYGVCTFTTADARKLGPGVCGPETIDLIVTSPPYGNATDYHLYHRFRLLWLGYNPRELAKIEIGSHLRHQKEASGFDEYLAEMQQSLSGMHRLLKPGRYAVLIVGDAIYKKVLYPAAEALSDSAKKIGFESVCIAERAIHSSKRSFAAAGRRATTEKLLVIRKPPKKVSLWLASPPYKLWPYEDALRKREIESVVGVPTTRGPSLELDPYSATKTRQLVFTHGVGRTAFDSEPTWQAILENGFARQSSARKDPKYVTHGLHPYKGKFYPQLAKGLMNVCALRAGASVFDPFCGSGTTLLEGYLNGQWTLGCDINPLAAKIARAKTGILEVNPDIVRETLGILVGMIEDAPAKPAEAGDQFDLGCLDEIYRWFSTPIIAKLNWLLGAIRAVSEGVVRDFLEVVLSSIIREVSQQAPNDLRIRRRKELIADADVFNMYLEALDSQYTRIEKFWAVRGYCPHRFRPSKVVEGDARTPKTVEALGLTENSVDLVLTSPPYATALPYIDTDRLSLLITIRNGFVGSAAH